MDFLSTELGCVYFRCIIYIYKYICENMCCKSLCFVSAFLSLNKQKKKGQEAILIQRDGIMSSFPVRLFADSHNWPICLPVSRGWDLCKVVWGVRILFEWTIPLYHCTKDWKTSERMFCYSRWLTRALNSIHVSTTFSWSYAQEQKFIEQSLSKGSYFSNILCVQQRF